MEPAGAELLKQMTRPLLNKAVGFVEVGSDRGHGHGVDLLDGGEPLPGLPSPPPGRSRARECGACGAPARSSRAAYGGTSAWRMSPNFSRPTDREAFTGTTSPGGSRPFKSGSSASGSLADRRGLHPLLRGLPAGTVCCPGGGLSGSAAAPPGYRGNRLRPRIPTPRGRARRREDAPDGLPDGRARGKSSAADRGHALTPHGQFPIVGRQRVAARCGQSVSSSCRRPWNIIEVPPSGRYHPSATMYGGT